MQKLELKKMGLSPMTKNEMADTTGGFCWIKILFRLFFNCYNPCGGNNGGGGGEVSE